MTAAQRSIQAFPVCPEVVPREWKWDATLERQYKSTVDGQVIASRVTTFNVYADMH